MSDAWFQTKLTTAAAAAEDDNAVSALRIYTPPLQCLFTGTASAATTADTLIASNLLDRAELLWQLIYAAAAELPEHHPALVDLLLALQSRHQTPPSPSAAEQHAPNPALASWLTLFGPTWRTRLDALRAAREDGFDRAAQFDADGKKLLPREGDMYVNFHAFSARLLGAGFAPDARGMLREAAWEALAGVLEREVEGYDGGIVRERFEIETMVLFWLDVWAGVQWVVFAGEEVRGGEGQKGQQEGERGGLLEVNGLWKGAEGFSEERWGFWRERLRGFLEVRGAVPEPVRGVVEEAVRCME